MRSPRGIDGALAPCRRGAATRKLTGHDGKERAVSIGVAAAATPVQGDESAEAAVEIDVAGRWDALALSELLIPFHSFLVQHTADRWVVHARAPGCGGEPLEGALRAIEGWRAERRVDASVRVAGRPVRASGVPASSLASWPSSGSGR
jgi:hypothetical protein